MLQTPADRRIFVFQNFFWKSGKITKRWLDSSFHVYRHGHNCVANCFFDWTCKVSRITSLKKNLYVQSKFEHFCFLAEEICFREKKFEEKLRFHTETGKMFIKPSNSRILKNQ